MSDVCIGAVPNFSAFIAAASAARIWPARSSEVYMRTSHKWAFGKAVKRADIVFVQPECGLARLFRAAPLGRGAAVSGYSGAARVGVWAAARIAAASLATRVPSKKRGFWVPHSLTAFVKVKARKSSLVMWPASTSS